MIQVLPLSSAILPPNFNLWRGVMVKVIIRGGLARGGREKKLTDDNVATNVKISTLFAKYSHGSY
jgi:hypothetical protein